MTTNEILFYVCLVLGIIFFILAVILFFALKVPSSMGFLLKMNKRGFKAVKQKGTSENIALDTQQIMSATSTRRTSANTNQISTDGPTEVLGQTGRPTQTQSRLAQEKTGTSTLKKKNAGKKTSVPMVDGPTEVLEQVEKPNYTKSRLASEKTATSNLGRNTVKKASVPVEDGATEILGTVQETVYSKASGGRIVEVEDEQTGVLIQEVIGKEKYKKNSKKNAQKAVESDVDSPTEILQ